MKKHTTFNLLSSSLFLKSSSYLISNFSLIKRSFMIFFLFFVTNVYSQNSILSFGNINYTNGDTIDIEIIFENNSGNDLAGMQFDIENGRLDTAYGGNAQTYGWTISFNQDFSPTSSRVLGFSLSASNVPADTSVIINIRFVPININSGVCLTNIVMSDGGGTSIPTDAGACLCNSVVSFPYYEGFENGASCWSNIQETGSADWTFGTGSSGGSVTSAYSGTNNAVFVSSSPSGGGTPITKLVSPVFDLTSLTIPRISFYYAQEDWFGDQNFTRLLYRTSSSGSWTEIWADFKNKFKSL